MKIRTILILFTTAIMMAGCATRTSSYLEHKPVLIYADQSREIPQLQKKAAKAFLAALNRYKWEIRNYNREESTIVAEACRGNECAEIMATILADASVSIIRTPGQVLTANEGIQLKRWVSSLQRQYFKNMRNVR